jgi:sulfite exporter TauE/SafE
MPTPVRYRWFIVCVHVYRFAVYVCRFAVAVYRICGWTLRLLPARVNGTHSNLLPKNQIYCAPGLFLISLIFGGLMQGNARKVPWSEHKIGSELWRRLKSVLVQEFWQLCWFFSDGSSL